MSRELTAQNLIIGSVFWRILSAELRRMRRRNSRWSFFSCLTSSSSSSFSTILFSKGLRPLELGPGLLIFPSWPALSRFDYYSKEAERIWFFDDPFILCFAFLSATSKSCTSSFLSESLINEFFFDDGGTSFESFDDGRRCSWIVASRSGALLL